MFSFFLWLLSPFFLFVFFYSVSCSFSVFHVLFLLIVHVSFLCFVCLREKKSGTREESEGARARQREEDTRVCVVLCLCPCLSLCLLFIFLSYVSFLCLSLCLSCVSLCVSLVSFPFPLSFLIRSFLKMIKE